MFTPSRLSFGIALSELFLRVQCSAIHSAKGTAYLRNSDLSRFHLAWGHQSIGDFMTTLLPQRTTQKSEILFSSTNSNLNCFQIGTRSFCARRGIDPVGAAAQPTSEMPP
jgi:hypothetical protein